MADHVLIDEDGDELAAVVDVERQPNELRQDRRPLVVKEASVGKSIVMKRFVTRARGRSSRIVKPFSRIRVVVREAADEAGE